VGEVTVEVEADSHVPTVSLQKKGA